MEEGVTGAAAAKTKTRAAATLISLFLSGEIENRTLFATIILKPSSW
jgi:hypothetical protein